MSEQQNREALERYFQTFERQDPGAFVELLHDDYVEEFPSRERGSVVRTIGERWPRTIPVCRV